MSVGVVAALGSRLLLLADPSVDPFAQQVGVAEVLGVLPDQMHENFTHVVVDSPPIASFTDGVLIASMVDGGILFVHSGKSSRQVVRRARQFLQDVGAKVFGVVLNNVNLRTQNDYYYQTYYQRDYYRHDDEN